MTGPEEGHTGTRPRRVQVSTFTSGPWLILIVAFVAQVGFSVVEMGLPIIAGYMKQDLELSAAAAGFVVSAYFIGKTIGSFPAGVAVDRVGESRILVIGGMLVGGTLLLGMSLPFSLLLAAIALAGLFSSVSVPAGGSLIRHAFPARRRGLALSIRQTGIPIGGLIAAALLPWIAHAFGWRWAVGLGGLLVAAATLPVLFANTPVHDGAPKQATDAAAPKISRATWLTADVKWLAVWGCCLVMGQFALLIFLPLDLHARRHLTLATGAAFVAIVQVAGVVGRLMWAVVSDRLLAYGRRPILLILTFASIASALLLAVTPGTGPVWAWIAAAVLAGFTINSYQGLWITMLTEAPDVRGVGKATGFAVTFTVASVAAAEPVLGAIADAAGTYRAIWLVLAGVFAIALLPAVRISSGKTPRATDLSRSSSNAGAIS